MAKNPFQDVEPQVEGNSRVRTPQREAYAKLLELAAGKTDEREVGVVLPVGCGKSGTITIAPFAFKSKRTLVVAPGTRIAKQLAGDFDPTNQDMFYLKAGILPGPEFPEPVEIRGKTTNIGDLKEAHVVITNIGQLQGSENRWLNNLPKDFFDLILFDEGHHSVAATWETLKSHFPNARIVNFSATPHRADGQRMAGRVIYSYPIFRAIEEGYIKRLKALVLNPKTLRFVRREDGKEVEVDIKEVVRLGEEDASFRRSIVTSTTTLNTIVDASIRALDRLRTETGEKRLKIIASALNYEHCIQIKAAYKARGRAAEYVHSKETGATNDKIHAKLDNHELDVIVQVRKLGEGFDHKYLSVAAVFSIFANLSPFVQFVGRIMRVIEQNAPGHILNQGVVVYHAGANIARQWKDFQEYSEADKAFFDDLLPVEDLDFSSASELEVVPSPRGAVANPIDVRAQSTVTIEEIPLLKDAAVQKALQLLRSRGLTPDQVKQGMELLPVPTTKALTRQAARTALDERVKNEVGRILGQRKLNAVGFDLDKKRLKRTNFVVLKAAIDKHCALEVSRKIGERHEFTQPELDAINTRFSELVEGASGEVFDGKA